MAVLFWTSASLGIREVTFGDFPVSADGMMKTWSLESDLSLNPRQPFMSSKATGQGTQLYL